MDSRQCTLGPSIIFLPRGSRGGPRYNIVVTGSVNSTIFVTAGRVLLPSCPHRRGGNQLLRRGQGLPVLCHRRWLLPHRESFLATFRVLRPGREGDDLYYSHGGGSGLILLRGLAVGRGDGHGHVLRRVRPSLRGVRPILR